MLAQVLGLRLANCELGFAPFWVDTKELPFLHCAVLQSTVSSVVLK